MNPGVSVCLFSYNYEKYIAETIESMLSQQTTFPVEIVVGDDCSTDRTREIVLDYQQRFPGKFVLCFNEKNVGGTKNWINTMNHCSGRYIALCDGDDYFIDPLKLQKQYDLHENNPDVVLSFHSVKECYDGQPEKDKVVEFEKTVYTVEDFLRQGWFVRTSTTFFNNGIIPKQPPEWVYNYPYRYDTILHVFLCMHGVARNIKEVMSVWRKHEKGMSLQLRENRINDFSRIIELHEELDRVTSYKYKKAVRAFNAEAYTGLFLHLVKNRQVLKHPALTWKSLVNMDYNMILRKFIPS